MCQVYNYASKLKLLSYSKVADSNIYSGTMALCFNVMTHNRKLKNYDENVKRKTLMIHPIYNLRNVYYYNRKTFDADDTDFINTIESEVSGI